MYKIFHILVVIMFLMTTVFADESCGVSAIPEAQIEYGCGCNYHTSKTGQLAIYFQSELDLSKPRMYIHGQLQTLQAQRVRDPMQPLSIGDQFTDSYSVGDLKISFENSVNFVCPPEAEGCEIMSFDTDITVTDGQCMQRLSDYSGDCGC